MKSQHDAMFPQPECCEPQVELERKEDIVIHNSIFIAMGDSRTAMGLG